MMKEKQGLSSKKKKTVDKGNKEVKYHRNNNNLNDLQGRIAESEDICEEMNGKFYSTLRLLREP